MPTIIALEQAIEDAGTGGQASYHVVTQYGCSLAGEGSSTVTLAGYVSRAAFDAGKRPLMHIAAQLKVRPTGDCAAWPDWFYQQILAFPSGANVLSGATPVFDDEASAEEAAA